MPHIVPILHELERPQRGRSNCECWVAGRGAAARSDHQELLLTSRLVELPMTRSASIALPLLFEIVVPPL